MVMVMAVDRVYSVEVRGWWIGSVGSVQWGYRY
jgi:hypothetical protein